MYITKLQELLNPHWHLNDLLFCLHWLFRLRMINPIFIWSININIVTYVSIKLFHTWPIKQLCKSSDVGYSFDQGNLHTSPCQNSSCVKFPKERVYLNNPWGLGGSETQHLTENANSDIELSAKLREMHWRGWMLVSMTCWTTQSCSWPGCCTKLLQKHKYTGHLESIMWGNCFQRINGQSKEYLSQMWERCILAGKKP